MQNDIRIKVDEYEIHKIFGYSNDTDFLTDLGGNRAYSHRLRYLTFVFMELVNSSNKERLYMSFMLSKILSAFAKKPLNAPTKVLEYINDNLTNKELEKIFLDCGIARVDLLGKDNNLTIRGLMEGFENGKEDK